MKFASVCSGIAADAVAWHRLGWQCQWFAEIEPFPSAVLDYHYTDVPNLGDMTKIKGVEVGPIDLLAGGTPCQSFSSAGRRAGLDDPRGNLALEFIRIAREAGARWLVWENVSGVLSANKGRDFGAILGEMEKRGYGWSYRILDASRFGVPQPRRRLFVIGYFGDWHPAAGVLFEAGTLCQGIVPGKKEGAEAAACASPGTEEGGDIFIVNAQGGQQLSIGVNACPTLLADDSRLKTFIVKGSTIRSLTPVERERLMGLPDDYTRVPWRGGWAPDSHRIKAIGNSIAVPVLRWIGLRITAMNRVLRWLAAAS